MTSDLLVSPDFTLVVLLALVLVGALWRSQRDKKIPVDVDKEIPYIIIPLGALFLFCLLAEAVWDFWGFRLGFYSKKELAKALNPAFVFSNMCVVVSVC